MRAFWKRTRVTVPFLGAPALLFIFQTSSRAAPQKAGERGLDVRIVTEKLAKRKGRYQLVGGVACAGFDEKQKVLLEKKHMRVMVASVAAPTVTISVK